MNIDEKHWNRIDEIERRDLHEAASKAYVSDILKARRNADLEQLKHYGRVILIAFAISIFFLALTWFGANHDL